MLTDQALLMLRMMGMVRQRRVGRAPVHQRLRAVVLTIRQARHQRARQHLRVETHRARRVRIPLDHALAAAPAAARVRPVAAPPALPPIAVYRRLQLRRRRQGQSVTLVRIEILHVPETNYIYCTFAFIERGGGAFIIVIHFFF